MSSVSFKSVYMFVVVFLIYYMFSVLNGTFKLLDCCLNVIYLLICSIGLDCYTSEGGLMEKALRKEA